MPSIFVMENKFNCGTQAHNRQRQHWGKHQQQCLIQRPGYIRCLLLHSFCLFNLTHVMSQQDLVSWLGCTAEV